VAKFIVVRLLWIIPVMLGVSVIVFGIMKLAPGDVAEVMAGTDGTAEDVALIREVLGLDLPVHVQYGRWVSRLIALDLGRSAVTKQPITAEIASRIAPTVELAAAAMFLAIIFGLVTASSLPTGSTASGTSRPRWRRSPAFRCRSSGLA